MEWGYAPLPAEHVEGMSKEDQIELFFAVADTNEDGRIDKQELLDFFNLMIDSMLF